MGESEVENTAGGVNLPRLLKKNIRNVSLRVRACAIAPKQNAPAALFFCGVTCNDPWQLRVTMLANRTNARVSAIFATFGRILRR
jgi:hypothetical protein